MEVHTFLAKCQQLKVLIIGDLMLDRYIWGKVERISPEAPVPIVEVQSEESRLGGAANVALNIQAMGAKPILCGAVGQDEFAATLLKLLQKQGFSQQYILQLPDRQTTVKTRLIGNQQQMLRIDREDKKPLLENQRQALLASLLPDLSQFDGIIFEDYDKGMIDPKLIATIVAEANQQQIPVAVDPKFRNFLHYAHCKLFKPNFKELCEGVGLELQKDDFEQIRQAVLRLREKMPHQRTFVTLSEQGVLLVDEDGGAEHIAAHYRNIADVSGAGDTVISVMLLGLLVGLKPLQAAQYANLAGGLVCEKLGVVPIDVEDLAKEGQKIEPTD